MPPFIAPLGIGVPRTWEQVWSLFQSLYDDIPREHQFDIAKPHLAHYTTMHVVEQIAKNNELWLSNPLFMNDIEEVRFGIIEGTNAMLRSETISASLPPVDLEKFRLALATARGHFERNSLFDTYILCLSEHDPGDQDGLLSMWRGYGDSGKGVAVVIDAAKLARGPDDSPLIVAKVAYATREERMAWFENCARRFIGIVQAQGLTGDEEIGSAAFALFARIRLFSLFSKHRGFSEEREWRVVYMPERDKSGLFKQHFSYFNGPRGVEPKLKLKVAPIPALGGQDVSLERLVETIILGPSVVSPLAEMSMTRMLVTLGRHELADRVRASRIPYRPG